MNAFLASAENASIESVRLLSLREIMQRYRLDHLAFSIATLHLSMRDLRRMNEDGLTDLPAEYPTDAMITALQALLASLERAECDKSLMEQLDSFIHLIESGKERRPSVVETYLNVIFTGVNSVLNEKMFLFMPNLQAEYWMNLEQFGESIHIFPEALGDMFEAGNCYASGRATACVFHSMRVAEHGLRLIAKELGIELKNNGKPLPIEYATWETVLRAIDNRRDELRKEIKGDEHLAKTIEYASFANHCSHLKDLWRNPTMHSRSLYSLQDSLAAMSRTAEFMKLIAASEYAPEPSEDIKTFMLEVKEMTVKARSKE